jgi:5-methylcytosine-specific restriction endonuclease McrA
MAWSTESRHARGYGSAWVKIRLLILKRDRYLCQPCYRANRLTQATQVDHINPKAKGGTDDSDNLEAICTHCHAVKTEREAAEAQGRTVKPTIGIDGWPIA